MRQEERGAKEAQHQLYTNEGREQWKTSAGLSVRRSVGLVGERGDREERGVLLPSRAYEVTTKGSKYYYELAAEVTSLLGFHADVS